MTDEFQIDGVTTIEKDSNGNRVITIETVVSNWHYAGAYSGADPDSRLDSALSAASAGDTIFLESDAYSADRTISTQLTLIGTGWANGADLSGAAWTLNSPMMLQGIGNANDNTTINADGGDIQIYLGFLGGSTSINVGSDRVLIANIFNGDVTFESGTADGLVDSCVKTTVTDNGTNNIGDLA